MDALDALLHWNNSEAPDRAEREAVNDSDKRKGDDADGAPDAKRARV